MLDNIERRRFLVEPARKYPFEPALEIAHIDLHEGPRQLLYFVRRRRLAGPQPDDHVVHPDRLTRLPLQIAREAVALVEQAQTSHPFPPRRIAGLGKAACRARV